MAIVINIVASGSNVGKTTLIEGLIKEIRMRGFSVSTIKHDVHGFDIDKEGKDTWKHRKAGAEKVIISSKKRMAVICEVEEEISLNELVDIALKSDFVIIEGYKNSKYKKIEVFRSGVSKKIITPKENLIAIASDVSHDIGNIPVVKLDDYDKLVDIIEKLKL
jgi:molybdopterin-guanine dinucleotide biosynthesis protein B